MQDQRFLRQKHKKRYNIMRHITFVLGEHLSILPRFKFDETRQESNPQFPTLYSSVSLGHV